jgi:hypothetical protein
LLPPSSGRFANPEDSNLHTHRRENLKSYLVIVKFAVDVYQVAYLILALPMRLRRTYAVFDI